MRDPYKVYPVWQRALLCLATWLAILCVIYLLVAFWAFEWRNPKANDVTMLRHIVDVLCWHRLPDFQ